jgi:hypothetical protein
MDKVVKKVVAFMLMVTLAMASLTGCGSSSSGKETEGVKATEAGTTSETAKDSATSTVGGKLLLLVNSSGGAVYNYSIAAMDMWTQELGYTYEIVYGDSSNDPAGNLSAVKNAMTSDVVGLIMMQDGGVSNIMTEYPDLYVVGLGTDMASVYSEGGASADAATNEKFLGTVAGGYAHGEDIGKMYAQTVIDKGYKKIAIVMFPSFAYPQYAIADKTIREEIATYNETASEPIEIVGEESTVLMFKLLDDTFFNEPKNQDLDAIIGLCSGQQFIYPTLATAIGNGIANPETKLVTSGLEDDQTLMDDVGTGIVQSLFVPNFEEIFYPIAMLDNAIQGKMYSDYTQSEVLDGVYVRITSDDVMTNIEQNSPLLDADLTKSSVSLDVGKQYLTRYNPDTTYAGLKEFMESDAFSEKAYE